MDEPDLVDSARRAFEVEGVYVVDVRQRSFVDEEILLISVAAGDIERAGQIAKRLDTGFALQGRNVVTSIRQAETHHGPVGPMPAGVKDDRATALRQLISSGSRTSEAQPSLAYIPDAAMNIESVSAPRHQLIFGRRGTGKTALMVEAKRVAEDRGDQTVWLNAQTLRNENLDRVFLIFVRAVLDKVGTAIETRPSELLRSRFDRLSIGVQQLLDESLTNHEATLRLIPDANAILKQYLAAGRQLFVYLDDFYYIPRQDQPVLLDMMHGCARDANCWLKIASIRNLTKWFETSPPTGLETGHDADVIDLDVTLQNPGRAANFLQAILARYAANVGISGLGSLFSSPSLDRLTLASGGVPRDYLVLAGGSITKARERLNARVVGVQDVNQAAGDASQIKIQELEEDGSANRGVPEQASRALLRIRSFCLDESSFTYFRVRHQDRDNNPEAFAVLNRLVEFRLLHSVAASISNAHKIGDASEVFMLDLSQYTGSRLKQKLWILDIENGAISAKRTRDSESARAGVQAREIVAIFRLAPEFSLERLADLVVEYNPVQLAIERLMQSGATRTVAELVAEFGAPYAEIVTLIDDLIGRGTVERATVDKREVVRAVRVPRQRR